MSATASLPASAAASSTTTRSSANSDGLSSSASSLVLTSPARIRFTGTSSVPACLRACRRTAATARSTSSSSSPSTRCRPATSSLTPRSCHGRPTVLTASTRAGTPRLRPHRCGRHRHRHATTAATPPTATHTTPSRPDGTPTDAPGTPAAHRATRSSHHNSGPVNRISSCAPAGHSGHSAAAAVPTTVIGGITAATARLATTATTLNVPDIPATSGAVTSCAATATLTASASGLGQPRADQPPRPHRCDDDQRRGRRHRQRETDVDGQFGRRDHQHDHAGRQHRNRLPAAVRHHGQQRDGAHHRRAQHARRRLHDDDERHQREPRPARRPASGRPAPPSAAPPRRRSSRWRPTPRSRCVSPDARNSAVGLRSQRRRVAEHQRGQHRRLIRRATRPAPHRRSRCGCPARPCRSVAASPSVGSPVADSTATVRSRRVGRPIRARKLAGRPAVSSANPTADAKTTTLPDISLPSIRCSDPRNIIRPPPSERGRLARRDDDGGDRAVPLDDRMVAQFARRVARPRRRTPVPTTATATTPAERLHATSAPASPAATTPPPDRCRRGDRHGQRPRTEPPTCQRIPAAVTAQLVSAAGTSRRSSRAAPASTGVTHGRGHAASPAAPARCRRRRRAGRRW